MEQLDKQIPALLLPWYAENHRALPWRQSREPYPVWLSEIMLQQTRVEAVKGYFTRFLQELPTIRDLAACDPERLSKLWEGLGYYSRMRNLQKAAQVIAAQYGGVFPQSYDAVRALPGIGDYTAGAICSICFDLPTPAVDGNVLRLIARLTDDHRAVTEAVVKREYTARLAEIYPPEAGLFTQALMELGATVCGPNKLPECERCPLAAICLSKKRGNQAALPVKAAKKPRRVEEKTVFLLTCGGSLAVCKRPETGLLAGLWELPNTEGTLEPAEALAFAERLGVQPTELYKMVEKIHIFTHVEWKMRCFYLECAAPKGSLVWVDRARLDADVALPTAFKMFLAQNAPQL